MFCRVPPLNFSKRVLDFFGEFRVILQPLAKLLEIADAVSERLLRCSLAYRSLWPDAVTGTVDAHLARAERSAVRSTLPAVSATSLLAVLPGLAALSLLAALALLASLVPCWPCLACCLWLLSLLASLLSLALPALLALALLTLSGLLTLWPCDLAGLVGLAGPAALDPAAGLFGRAVLLLAGLLSPAARCSCCRVRSI